MEKKFKSILLIGILAHVNYMIAQNTYINSGDSIKNNSSLKIRQA